MALEGNNFLLLIFLLLKV